MREHITHSTRKKEMTVKKVHFGERVLVLIDEKFKTQAELAKALGRVQSSVARMVASENFATTPAVRKNLQKLAKYGVNPEYLWNPLVSDWRMAAKVEVDETSIHRLRIIIDSVRQERDQMLLKVTRLEEMVAKLKEELARCQQATKK